MQHANWSGPHHYAGHDLEALADMPRYYDWILRTFGPHLRGRVLEVGAGTGNFAACYLPKVGQAVLLEPARNLSTSLAARFAHLPQVRVLSGVLADLAEANRGSFDAAVMVNVLEHIEDDQAACIRLAHLIRPGGTLLIFVPAMRWLYGTMDLALQHYRRYTRSSLGRLLRNCGYELSHLRYFDAAGVLPWLAAGRLLKCRNFNPRAATIYDRFVVPVASRLERWVPLPWGKNVICVARSPAHSASLRAAA